MPVQMRISAGRLDELGSRLTKAQQALIAKTETELDEYGSILVLAIDKNTPKREGSTAQSIKYVIKGRGTKEMELQIIMGASNRPKKLIEWLRFGTGIYGPRGTPIVPKKYKFLKFDIGGETIFARSVRGMKGHDFIQAGWDETAAQRRSMIGRIGRLAMTMLGDSRSE